VPQGPDREVKLLQRDESRNHCKRKWTCRRGLCSLEVGEVDAVGYDADSRRNAGFKVRDDATRMVTDGDDPVRVAQSPAPKGGAAQLEVVCNAVFGAHDREFAAASGSGGECVRTKSMRVNAGRLFLREHASEPVDVRWAKTAPKMGGGVLADWAAVANLQARILKQRANFSVWRKQGNAMIRFR
jgi:hypothetical protein